jgi:hypothetical protein
MNEAKIQLSEEELILVENAELILTKNAIIRKVYDLFGAMAAAMKIELQNNPLSPDLMETTPKISRGENFKGLPFVVLDYPRLFNRENVFAIRSLFWWGKYFSVTLHLKGVYKELFSDQLKKNDSLLSDNDFYISSSNDEWSHELGEENYISLNRNRDFLRKNDFSLQPFLKLSAKIDLQNWNQSEELLMQIFKTILQSLHY